MKISKLKSWIIAIIILIVSVSLGAGIGTIILKPSRHTHSQTTHQNTSIWTCAMHPQIRKEKPGKCPICHMDLIPIETYPKKAAPDSHTEHTKDRESNFPTIQLSPYAEKLAELELSEVKKAYAAGYLSVFGKLAVDETRLKSISARFPGRIDRLFIDTTGINVKKNDHMAEIYSPELLIAQQELIDAIRSSSTDLANSAREKLKLWGFSRSQIKSIETTNKIARTLTINTPSSGTIIEKTVKEGDYITTGTKLFSIADLSKLWLLSEVYESDLSKLHFGQTLTFTTDAYPGREFTGTLTFIDPTINPRTRTIRIRAVVDNHNDMLKPEMLTKASIHIRYAENGPIKTHRKNTNYVCPMHPEEFSSIKENCDICGMPMEKSTTLGLTTKSITHPKPLIIPSSAPLITGKRAVVYVKVPDTPGLYEGRTVKLGPKVGEFYIVEDGLKEGEFVVSKGNFKIDSTMQIQAKPSMMQSEGGKSSSAHNH